MFIVPGLQANIFSTKRALQKSFQATSEGDTLILNKYSTVIRFDDKTESIGGK